MFSFLNTVSAILFVARDSSRSSACSFWSRDFRCRSVVLFRSSQPLRSGSVSIGDARLSPFLSASSLAQAARSRKVALSPALSDGSSLSSLPCLCRHVRCFRILTRTRRISLADRDRMWQVLPPADNTENLLGPSSNLRRRHSEASIRTSRAGKTTSTAVLTKFWQDSHVRV